MTTINNHMIYVMKECGCRVYRWELVTIKNSNALHCPFHPDNKIDHLEKNCETCGKLLLLTTQQSTAKYCPSCAKIAKKERDDVARAKDMGDDASSPSTFCHISKQEQASSDRWDCVHRDKCRNDNMMKKYLPCLGCEKYLSMRDYVAPKEVSYEVK